MGYQVELVTGPASEPLTVAEAKAHMRVDIADEDAIFARLIASMRQCAETRLKRALVTQTHDLVLDEWPTVDQSGVLGRFPQSPYSPISVKAEIRGIVPPLQSVTSITYLDTTRNLQTVSPSDYRVVAGFPGRVFPITGKVWPAALREPAVITVRYVTGWAETDPRLECVRTWMLLNLGTFYENRESIITGTIVAPVTQADSLLAPASWGGY